MTKGQLAPFPLLARCTTASIWLLFTRILQASAVIEAYRNSFGIKPAEDWFALYVNPIFMPMLVYQTQIADLVLTESADIILWTDAVDGTPLAEAASILHAVSLMTRIEGLAVVEIGIDDDSISAVCSLIVTFKTVTSFVSPAFWFEFEVADAVTVTKAGVATDIVVNDLILTPVDYQPVGKDEDA